MNKFIAIVRRSFHKDTPWWICELTKEEYEELQRMRRSIIDHNLSLLEECFLYEPLLDNDIRSYTYKEWRDMVRFTEVTEQELKGLGELISVTPTCSDVVRSWARFVSKVNQANYSTQLDWS